ncbi:hypothetical protein GCM10027589_21140 [Actinocorallia lasiicapitis]
MRLLLSSRAVRDRLVTAVQDRFRPDQTDNLAVLDSPTILRSGLPGGLRLLALLDGPRDPLFGTGLITLLDGIADRSSPDADLVRAVQEVISGAGWISPHLVPRYRETAFPTALPTGPWRTLTTAELPIALLVLDGLTNAQIAARLGLETGTVKNHLTKIYRKLGHPTRARLLASTRAENA